MSSGKIENQILDAVQTIVDSAIANAGFDRTIQAQIAKCANEEKGKYAVKYQDGVFYAYSSNVDVTYSKGDNVYVLIPKNDMSETKTILGLVENLGADYISTVEEEDKYETVGQDCVLEQISIGLCSYVSSQEIDLYNVNSTPTTLEGFTFDLEAFEFYLKKSNCFRGGADFRTVLPESQHYDGNFGICYELVFGDNATGAERTISYKIDIDKMEGDPYFLPVATHQYGIWNIDSENFIRLKRIYVFQNNFPNQASGKPNDIFITNVDLMGVNPIQTDETSNCSLSIVTPQGIYFDDNDLSSSTRLVSTIVRAKGKAIPEDSSLLKYYWFKENNTVSYNSILFQRYGGPGWECLNNYNTIAEGVREWLPGDCNYTIQKSQVLAKENSYKCVVIYNEKTILTKEFIIYNNSSTYNVVLSSSAGTQFYYDIGETTLTCLVNNMEHTESAYTYSWSMVDNIGDFSKITGTTNKISVSARTINNYTTYKCIVSYNGNKIGKAEIVLKNSLEGESAYVALITDGNQVFKYNENGISPASEAIENPITVLPLGFKLYDDMGTEVTQTAIGNSNVEWWVPTSNTMLSVLSSYGSPARTEDGYYVYTNTYTIGFEIAKTYNSNYTNNEIILKIKYKDKKITSKTNFNFLKEGQNGSNGTDFVCRLIPNVITGETTPKNVILTHNDAGTTNNYTLNYNRPSSETNFWFNAELYHNGVRIFKGHASGQSSEDISSNTVSLKWSVLANKYKYDTSVTPAVTYEDQSNLTINESTGAITFSETELTHPANIVKCVLTYNEVEYVATIPVILVRATSNDYKISLKENTGFLSAMYTTDGRNPIYNNISPFELTVEEDEEEITELSTLTYDWTIKGQVYLSNWQSESNLIIRNITSPHKVYYLTSDTIYQSGKSYYKLENSTYTLLVAGVDYSIGGTVGSNIYEMRVVNNIKYIKPADTFDGMCVSNGIHCSIKNSGIEIADIHIPVYLYLNRYGHAAINGWDGNTISLNDNAGIILSPQVGAGKKNATDNTFTGVLMGSVKESGSTEVETGLFGYNSGVRTIKLDAETGSAEFGTEDSGKIVIAPNEGTAGHAYLRSGNYEITYTRVLSGNTYTNSDLYFSKTNDVYTELKKDVDYTVGATITANNIYKLSTGGAGLEIDLTDPHIRFGSGNFRVDADGRVFATEYATANIKLNSSSVTGLDTRLDTIDDDVEDLKDSTNYLEVSVASNTLTVLTDSNRIPIATETKTLDCVSMYKGAVVQPSSVTISGSYTGIFSVSSSYDSGRGVTILSFTVKSTTALQNSINTFDVTFNYNQTGCSSITKKISIVTLEKGKDGTSVTIKGNYTNITALCTAHPSGNTLGDGYILSDNSIPPTGAGESGHLFVFTNGGGTQGAGTSDWNDVGKFQGENGENGRGIQSIAYMYLANNSSIKPGESASGWDTELSRQMPDTSKRYLWQKETITFLESDGTTSTQVTIILLTVYGETGKGISSTEVKYQQGDNGTVAPTGTWLDNPPSIAEGKYLWTRIVITYTDSNTSTSYSIAYKGSNGEDGEDGRGVATLTEYYAISDSEPEESSEIWQTSVPSYVSGKTYWRKIVTTWSDSSSSAVTIFEDNGTTSSNSTAKEAKATAEGADSTASQAKSEAEAATSEAGRAIGLISGLNDEDKNIRDLVNKNKNESIEETYLEYCQKSYSFSNPSSDVYDEGAIYYIKDANNNYIKARPVFTQNELQKTIDKNSYYIKGSTPTVGNSDTWVRIKPEWKDGTVTYQRTTIKYGDGTYSYSSPFLTEDYQTIDDLRYSDASKVLAGMRGTNNIFYNDTGLYVYNKASESDATSRILINSDGILFGEKSYYEKTKDETYQSGKTYYKRTYDTESASWTYTQLVAGTNYTIGDEINWGDKIYEYSTLAWRDSSVWVIDGTFNAQDINVTHLTADSIQDGTLTLGTTGSDGKMVIQDDTKNVKIELNSQRAIYNLENGGHIIIAKDCGLQVLNASNQIQFGSELTWTPIAASGTLYNNINYYTEQYNLMSLRTPDGSGTVPTGKTYYTVSCSDIFNINQIKINNSINFGDYIQTINMNVTDENNRLHQGVAFLAK